MSSGVVECVVPSSSDKDASVIRRGCKGGLGQHRANQRRNRADGCYPSWNCPVLGVCASSGAIGPSSCRCCRVRVSPERHGHRVDAQVSHSVPVAPEQGVLLTIFVVLGARHADVGEVEKGPPPGTPTSSRKCTRGPYADPRPPQ